MTDITKQTVAGFCDYLTKIRYNEKKGMDLEETTREIQEKFNKSYQETIAKILELSNERSNLISLIKVFQAEYRKAKGDVVAELPDDESEQEEVPQQVKNTEKPVEEDKKKAKEPKGRKKKEETKEEVKQEVKEEVKPEVKEEVKEDDKKKKTVKKKK